VDRPDHHPVLLLRLRREQQLGRQWLRLQLGLGQRLRMRQQLRLRMQLQLRVQLQ